MNSAQRKNNNNDKYDLLTISLAGHIICIRSNDCFINRKAFEKFVVDSTAEEAEHTVVIDYEAYAKRSLGGGNPSIYFMLHQDLSDWLITKNTLTFHASSLIYRGKAYLFSAPSGTGKSTHAHLWRSVFGKEVNMISDDQPLIRFDEAGIFACGSIWNGKDRIGNNIEAPIGGICLLSRGETNRIERLPSAEALVGLSPNVYIPSDPMLAGAALKLLGKLAVSVPIYSLSCNMTHEAAVFARNSLIGSDSDENGL